MKKEINNEYYVVIREESNVAIFNERLSKNISKIFSVKNIDTKVSNVYLYSDVILSFTKEQVNDSEYLSSIFSHHMGNICFVSIPGIKQIFNYNDFDWIYDNESNTFKCKHVVKNSLSMLYKIQLYITRNINNGKFTLSKNHKKLCVIYKGRIYNELIHLLSDDIKRELINEGKVKNSLLNKYTIGAIKLKFKEKFLHSNK